MSDFITLENCTVDPFWVLPGVDERIRKRESDIRLWQILSYLELFPDLTQTEIGAKFGVSGSSISKLLKKNRFSKKGAL